MFLSRSLVVVFALALPSAGQSEPLAVTTVEHEAPSVGRKMKYNIILPRDYEQSGKRYPTLYLLHGLSSNYTHWALMRVPEHAAGFELIVVMPDAGNSWYVNWAKSEETQKNAWEDYIIKDLIGHVDATYRTVVAREGRAINGLSMGGYGAIMLGLRHPGMFCSIGSHSGALSFARSMRSLVAAGKAFRRRSRSRFSRPNRRIGIEGFSSQVERTPRGAIFSTVEECDRHDPFELVQLVSRNRLPHIYLDCGTEDALIKSARAFAELLRTEKVPFTYAESRGMHMPNYWAREVGHSMAVQYAIIRRALRDAKKRSGK